MTPEEYAKRHHAEKVRQRYAALASERRCTQCGGQDARTLAGRTRCETCYAKAYKPRNERSAQQKADEIRRHKELRQERIDARQCRECGNQDYLTLRGQQLCAKCRRRRNENAKRYAESGKRSEHSRRCREERIAKELCTKCGRNKPESGRRYCTDCLVRERLYKRKYRAIIDGLGEQNVGGI